MKRILLFIATNLAVLLVLTIVARLLGIDTWLAVHGSSLGGLLIWAAIFGFGGSLISLLLSKSQAKMFMGVQVIGQTTDPALQWLRSVVEHHARRLGVGMPEVGIFQSPEPNAFATGEPQLRPGRGQHRAPAAHESRGDRRGAWARDVA